MFTLKRIVEQVDFNEKDFDFGHGICEMLVRYTRKDQIDMSLVSRETRALET